MGYRIGLMVGGKSIDYVHAIRVGVQNTLEEAGHTLVSVSDNIPFHFREHAGDYFRVTFQIASVLGLDAIIVPAGTVATYLVNDKSNLGDLLEILDSSRTVIVERDLEGYRCVSKDNVSGMRECMTHLIETCGLTKIAFIGGPSTSTGAREREEVFYEEMAAHGLDVPASMVTHGDLSGECGDKIDKLIDANPDLEGIVCCCDLIAHSVYRVLEQRSLRVGIDMAVTGFDDHQLSAHLDPPLSTVHLTGYDLGCAAAREAIRLCDGLPQVERILMSHFIARASCGEDTYDQIAQYRELLRERPFPISKIVDAIVDGSLYMADRAHRESFRARVEALLGNVRTSYLWHKFQPNRDIPLFTSHDIESLFGREYDGIVSLDGFETVVLALLQALVEEEGEKDAAWAVEQAENLHRHVVRALSMKIQEGRQAGGRVGWETSRIGEDALRASGRVKEAYGLILRDLVELGILKADFYLLQEPIDYLGAESLSLPDALQYVGSIADGVVEVSGGDDIIQFHQLLERYGSGSCSVSGIMAAGRLLGVAAFDAGTLGEDVQLVMLLNLGIAFGYLR